MDFDIIDDVKPRFQLQSGPLESEVEEKELNHVLIGVCSSVGVLLLALSWFQMGTLRFLCLWLSLSLFIGPFAPVSLTGGNCRVGEGELIPDLNPLEEVSAGTDKRAKGHKRRLDATVGKVSSMESSMPSTVPAPNDNVNGKPSNADA
ncbi:transcription factor MAMYB [Physcomitrium patens]|uniref:Uncharacterized protein n=1 Tax=Physcomitrium patens TaxID=3218 RepID=A9RI53_PHYPA|nr:transcription factor MAMYB-like [Physcomitrium patens]PNR29128.1 hypothetical protein PHYPA_027820 [Physcomitrium patens]|eukprot:XP_024362275.1 transcription factor MAMYB-like [Physcomitrella patens]